MAQGLRVPQIGSTGGGFYDRSQSKTQTGLSAYTAQNPGSTTEELVKKTAGGAVSSGAGMAAAGASIGSSVMAGTSTGAAAGGGYGAAIGAAVGVLAYLLS